MIEPLYRWTAVPLVEQKLATDPVNGSIDVNIPAGATVTLISDVPSIFAHSVTVFIDPNAGGLTNLTLRKYAGSRSMFIDTVIAAAIPAAGVAVDNTSAQGESYDVRVTNPTAGIITVRCWTCAKQV